MTEPRVLSLWCVEAYTFLSRSHHSGQTSGAFINYQINKLILTSLNKQKHFQSWSGHSSTPATYRTRSRPCEAGMVNALQSSLTVLVWGLVDPTQPVFISPGRRFLRNATLDVTSSWSSSHPPNPPCGLPSTRACCHLWTVARSTWTVVFFHKQLLKIPKHWAIIDWCPQTLCPCVAL